MAWVADYLATLEGTEDAEDSLALKTREELGAIHPLIIFERDVVVFGDTGAGKTNLVNHVFGKNIYESYPSAQSVTVQCQKFTMRVNYEEAEYVIHMHDTVGWNDTKKGDGVAEHFYRYLSDNVRLITKAIYVLKFDRAGPEWCKRFAKNLGRINKWAHESLIIVVTHCTTERAMLSFFEAIAQNALLKTKLDQYNLNQSNFVFCDLDPGKTGARSNLVTQKLLLRVINSKSTHINRVFPAVDLHNK